MNPLTLLLAAHVLAVVFWVGSLVSITRLLSLAKTLSGDARAKLTDGARAVYRSVSSSAMGIALLAGLGLIAANTAIFRMGWFHPKLTSALVMLGLHFVLGAKVRKAQAAPDDAAYQSAVASLGALQWAVVLTAALAVFAVIVLKTMMH
ncbi:MAG: CopD family protein [Polyangiales bacterium]